MWNVLNKITASNNLEQHVNLIATQYILKQNYKDLINIKNDENYCNNLIILTGNIINKSLTKSDIIKLYNHIFNESKTTIEKEMCIEIASFYIKINYIFSAITTTIYPIESIKNIDLIKPTEEPPPIDKKLELSTQKDKISKKPVTAEEKKPVTAEEKKPVTAEEKKPENDKQKGGNKNKDIIIYVAED